MWYVRGMYERQRGGVMRRRRRTGGMPGVEALEVVLVACGVVAAGMLAFAVLNGWFGWFRG